MLRFRRLLRLLAVFFCTATTWWHGSAQAPALRPVLPHDLSLDGEWQTGIDRNYNATTSVPGLAQDPARVSPGTLWYRRTVALPAGDWTAATLTLRGARFHPSVYVDGKLIATSEGGMAPTFFLLKDAGVAPGRTITLEIALRSMRDMDHEDASTVPGADLWRTNISSGLWDDVSLHFSHAARLTHAIPFTDFDHRKLSVHWKAENNAPDGHIRAEVLNLEGNVLAHGEAPAAKASGSVDLHLPSSIQPWSPQHPQLYKLRLTLQQQGQDDDTAESTWALKQFATRDRRFFLNNEPIELLGGTVVWQRFLRQPGASDVAWDVSWFQQNITSRLKSYGANTLRWHLGLPPERLLDLCDREGLMVQMEWPFFHGIAASVPSMEQQWTAWLDVAMRHPSVVLVHPWNEVGGSVDNGRQALNAILPEYPPLAVAHRDTVHIHKYWWSLFENLGLYYDSVSQFDKTAMVDEFGGNYLDWNGDPGGYPSTRESFLRFLGRSQTRAQRLEFHAESNARVAEYWRRIGAPGILPFCILGSLQDGNSWFLGDLRHPQPMPVWDALAAAWSPISLSLDVWDRNYLPGQTVTLPLYLFNDSDHQATLSSEVRIIDPKNTVVARMPVTQKLLAHEHRQVQVTVTLPSTAGALRLEAQLLNPPDEVKHPVISSWDIRTLQPKLPGSLAQVSVALADPAESELRQFLMQNGIAIARADDPRTQIVVGSTATWTALGKDAALRSRLSSVIARGASVVLLDIGPRDLGEGCRKNSLGSLEGAPVVRTPYTETATLFDGIRLSFQQVAEPESHIQPALATRTLWNNLPTEATWIWNGLRGGLIMPSADMEVSGLSQPALLEQWKARGADPQAMRSGAYYSYILVGYYAFSTQPEDKPTQAALRNRVRLLAQDAPALKDVLNPDAAIDQVDLAAAYRSAADGSAQQLQALSSCGKNLTRNGIVEISFGPGKGRLILSQALTAGRLARGSAESGFYGIRYDPAAEQFTLNMIVQAVRSSTAP